MNLKKLEILIAWQLMVLLLFQTMTELQAQTTSPPLQIATSKSSLATAYNNGRRIVRDSRDHRYVVYQDIRGDLPIICFVHSSDGKVWSQPDTLAAGAFPSLAIDQTDRLFLVWQAADTSHINFTYSKDSGVSWKIPYIKISQVDSEKTQFPVIEAGQQRIHIAWQQDFYIQSCHCVQEIFYTSTFLDVLESRFARPVNISRTEHDSKFPSIAHNLAFEEGNLHLVWYDSTSSDSSMMTMIIYRTFEESLTNLELPLLMPPYILSDYSRSRSVHPAVSVGQGEFVQVVWGTVERDQFFSYLFEIERLVYWNPVEILTPADPFICIDDAYVKSSAVVWMNDNEIYYMQTRDAQPISSYIPVSQIDTVRSMYPGVCYKNFNRDSLDVVWTEGNT